MREFDWPDARTVLAHLGLSPDELTLLWHQQVALEGARAELPGHILSALFPDPIVEIAGHAITSGPVALSERLEVFCRREALRPAPQTRARPGGGRISSGTIDSVLAGGRRFARAAAEIAARSPEAGIEGWRWLPMLAQASRLGARPAYTDRSAPALAHVRELLDALSVAIDRSRWSTLKRRRLIRNRLLLAVVATTGARIGAVSRLTVGDYQPARSTATGDPQPALRLRPGKTLPAHLERWKPLPHELGDWIEQHIALNDLAARSPLFPKTTDPDRPMTPDSLTKLLSVDHPLALGRSAHTLRHLAEQLAYQAGRHYLRETEAAIPAQAYADALLDHAFAADPLGYKDTERRREELAGKATAYIWKRLRRTEPAGESPTAQLRRQRMRLVEQNPGSLTDRQLLELLLVHAHLTTMIDDLEHAPG